jgi:hypothetical protein
MLDTKGDVVFGPLHGPWKKEHTRQARLHISYILINSKNYASGKDQIGAAWATKFSANNLRDYRDNSDLSDETESEVHGTDNEGMMDVEMDGRKPKNVFLSLIQDFRQKLVRESWVTVETVLKGYTPPRGAQPPPSKRDTQFIIILKGNGPETYECLKNPKEDKDSIDLQDRTNRCLKELRSARVDYVDEVGGLELIAMQNIPLVYGEDKLWSEKWREYSPRLEEGLQDEPQKAHGMGDWPTDVVEDVGMADVE